MDNYNDFILKYKPIINPIARKKHGAEVADENVAGYNGYMFQVFGEDAEYVHKIRKENPLRVWTIVDGGDSIGYYLIALMRKWGGVGYIITEIPAEDEDLGVGL